MNPIAKWFFLRWLKGKVSDWRKDEGFMGKLWKGLDGWRMVLGVLVVFGVGVYDAATGGHAGGFASSVLTTLGWMPGNESGFTVDGILAAAGSALAVFGFFAKLYKAAKQLRAGAKVGELLSTNGYVKEAVAEKGITATVAIATGGVTPPALAK